MSRANTSFVRTNDHAVHTMGRYGSVINQTPHLDRVAQDGMRFDNFFCTNATTSHANAQESLRPRGIASNLPRWAIGFRRREDLSNV